MRACLLPALFTVLQYLFFGSTHTENVSLFDAVFLHLYYIIVWEILVPVLLINALNESVTKNEKR